MTLAQAAAAALPLAALLLPAPAPATGGAGDSDGIIHACAHRRSGRLRVVADPGACRFFERPLSWNAAGPPGPPGPPGPSGVGNTVFLTSTGSVAVLEGDAPAEIPGLAAAIQVEEGARLLIQGDLREYVPCPGFVSFSRTTTPWSIDLEVDGAIVARRESPGDQGNIWNPITQTFTWLSPPLPAGSHAVRFLLSAPPPPAIGSPQARVCIGSASDDGRQARVAIIELRL